MKTPANKRGLETAAEILAASDWIERDAAVKKIAAELERHNQPVLIPHIRLELKRRFGVVISHEQIWVALYGRRAGSYEDNQRVFERNRK